MTRRNRRAALGSAAAAPLAAGGFGLYQRAYPVDPDWGNLGPCVEERYLHGQPRDTMPPYVLYGSAVVTLGDRTWMLWEVGESLGQPGGLDAAALTAAVAVTAVAVSDVRSMVGLGREALDGMNQFSQVLLPTMAAAAAAGGAPSTAAARQLATVLFSDLLLTAIDEVLLPMVYAYVAVCAAHAALGNDGLKRLASLLKWGVTTALTAILLVFVGYLTVSGAIAGTADAMALKAAKMTISGRVPVVGGILSDAAGTLLAGAGVLRGTIGVFGLLVVLGLCLGPFLELGVHYLVYKLAAALAATVSGGSASTLIDGIGGAFGLVLGMTGSGALLLLVSLVSAISMTAGG